MSEAPFLSHVVPATSWGQVERVVAAVAAQDDAAGIEVVLVSPAERPIEVPPEARERLWDIAVVTVEDHAVLHSSRGAGVRAARAPLVVLGETHCYPQAGWARALADAFADGCVAVGPAMENANPRTGLSWSNLVLDYGPWVRPSAAASAGLPGQNSAISRDALLGFGAGLEDRLRMPYLLLVELGERGGRLRVEPRARTAHLNVTRWRSWAPERFCAARVFATDRSRGWPAWRRALYAAGAPAIPLLRGPQALADLRRARAPMARAPMARALLPLAGGLLASAVGEAAGYLAGAGRAEELIYAIEFDRELHAPR